MPEPVPTVPSDANGVLEDFRIEFMDGWRRLPNKGLFLLLLAAWLALFHFLGNATLGYIPTPSLLGWMHAAYASTPDANGTDDSHGRLIPFAVLALFWWKRKTLLALPLRTWWPGLLLVVLALGLHLVGYMVQQPRISIMALFVGVYGLMGLCWGPAWLRESFFPYILFAFCIPLGWSAITITFPLRMLVVRLVEIICHNLLAIDIIVQGTSIFDPTGRYQYEVAAACSGMRSLIATLAVAVIYAMVSFRSWWRRGVLVAAAVPLAVLGNVVRMLTIVIAAEIGGQEWGAYIHEGGPGGIFSLLPYAAAFAGLLLLGSWLHEPSPKAPPPPAAPNG
ncbi:MAG TPA: exosortase/archaeosortase family protein [Candidatus Paceibacterota bacterium]|nr:exosortase/archaeosortase family protein [Candidatus Paceibacterota bacterium]